MDGKEAAQNYARMKKARDFLADEVHRLKEENLYLKNRVQELELKYQI